MKNMRIDLAMLAAVFLAVGLFTGCKPAETKSEQATKPTLAVSPAGETIYGEMGKWDNQNGDSIQLSSLKGKIPVLSMVFTRCTFACPRIVGDLKAIEQKIPRDKKDKVVFVLISFDSDRDHTAELQKFVQQNKLGKQWLVLHGDEESVRNLSMLLDVKYKKQANGDFTHSSSIALLDQNGGIVTQVEGLGADATPLIEGIKAL
ncbi:MAG: hypothetical protein K0S09_3029 [Sphingobacteriaceae bacterium]|nr:hypothetical protein [Sphingobacteriaceae bacterium]